MEVCRKLDNFKLENRPYTEVSRIDYINWQHVVETSNIDEGANSPILPV